MKQFKFIDLFAGIGGMRMAFESTGACCVFSSEYNKFAQQTYYSNFGEVPAGDITMINEKDIPEHDILIAGFPCQPFSLAGNQLGFSDTRGTLFFDIARILQHHKPVAFLLENVKNLISHDKGNTYRVILGVLKELGYTVYAKVLDAKHFVPQHRERVFIAGVRSDLDSGLYKFPDMPTLSHAIKNILLEDVDNKYTLSDKAWEGLKRHAQKHKEKGNGFGYGLVDLESISRTLLARYCNDGSEILIPQDGKNPRRLTPRECARLMGYPDSFKIVVSDSQAYKQFGNSVVVPLVESIANQLIKYLDCLI